jgi:hypothetical protein
MPRYSRAYRRCLVRKEKQFILRKKGDKTSELKWFDDIWRETIIDESKIRLDLHREQ